MKVDPQSSVYTGDTVTLTCTVESTGWEFHFYKGSQPIQPQSPADKDTNTIRVTVSDEGTAEFKCAARRGNYNTRDSDPVKITVRGTTFLAHKFDFRINRGGISHIIYDQLSHYSFFSSDSIFTSQKFLNYLSCLYSETKSYSENTTS